VIEPLVELVHPGGAAELERVDVVPQRQPELARTLLAARAAHHWPKWFGWTL
jgi:hypothetical protein